MLELPSKVPNPYEAAIIEIWRLIKFNNPSVLLSIDPDDLKYLATDLSKYPIDIVLSAKEAIRVCDYLKSLTLGLFAEKCEELFKVQKAGKLFVDETMNRRTRIRTEARRRLASRGLIDQRIGGKYDFDAMRAYDEEMTREEQKLSGIF